MTQGLEIPPETINFDKNMQDDDLLEFVEPSRLLSTVQVGSPTIKITALI